MKKFSCTMLLLKPWWIFIRLRLIDPKERGLESFYANRVLRTLRDNDKLLVHSGAWSGKCAKLLVSGAAKEIESGACEEEKKDDGARAVVESETRASA